MLNLLIRSDRYTLKHEFIFRFVNVFLVFGTLAIWIAMILLFAPHIVVLTERNIIHQNLEAVQNSADSKAKKELDKITKQLQTEYNMLNIDLPEYSGFLSQITGTKIDGIRISSFSFVKNSPKEGKEYVTIELRGIAGNRNALVSYANALKEIESFEKVDLPLSNLAKDFEVPFTVSIKTYNLKKIDNEEN